VLGRWPGAAGQALRGALGAPYLAAAAFVLLQLGKMRPSLWILIYCVAVSLVLVPAQLLEPRYFTLPVFIATLNSPQLSPRSLVLGVLASALVDAGAAHVFLRRPFPAGPGEPAEQRFLW